MVIAEADRADAEAAARQLAEAKLTQLEPKARAADALMDADGTLSIGAVANMYGVGRTTLFRILYAEQILQRDKRPYQKYAGYFRVVAAVHESGDGREFVHHTAYLYPAGALRLWHVLTRRGHTLREPRAGGGAELALLDPDGRAPR